MLREEVSKKLRQRYIRDDVPIALQQAAVAIVDEVLDKIDSVADAKRDRSEQELRQSLKYEPVSWVLPGGGMRGRCRVAPHTQSDGCCVVVSVMVGLGVVRINTSPLRTPSGTSSSKKRSTLVKNQKRNILSQNVVRGAAKAAQPTLWAQLQAAVISGGDDAVDGAAVVSGDDGASPEPVDGGNDVSVRPSDSGGEVVSTGSGGGPGGGPGPWRGRGVD